MQNSMNIEYQDCWTDPQAWTRRRERDAINRLYQLSQTWFLAHLGGVHIGAERLFRDNKLEATNDGYSEDES